MKIVSTKTRWVREWKQLKGNSKPIIIGSTNLVSGQSDQIRGERLPIFAIPKSMLCDCGCGGFHTLQHVMKVLAWSFTCLSKGISPDRRHDGSRFTQHDENARMPVRVALPPMCLLQIRGDWEWLTQAWRTSISHFPPPHPLKKTAKTHLHKTQTHTP